MKYLFPLMLTVLFLFGFEYPVSKECTIKAHLLYGFCHANILHLAINIYAYIKLYNTVTVVKRPYIPVMVILGSFISGYFATTPTVGCSGGLFFLLGIQTGYVLACGYNAWKTVAYVIFGIGITVFMPHIGTLIHLIGFIAGMTIGSIYGGFGTNKKAMTA